MRRLRFTFFLMTATFVVVQSLHAQLPRLQDIHEAWKKRSAATARISAEIEINSMIQAGYYNIESFDSPQPKPFPLEDSNITHSYSVALDAPNRHRIESKGPRFQQPGFRFVFQHRTDVHAPDYMRSLNQRSGDAGYPATDWGTIRKRRFSSDKTFELLPLFVAYQPFDSDVTEQFPISQCKIKQLGSNGASSVVILATERQSTRFEWWVTPEGDFPIVRFLALRRVDSQSSWTSFIDMRLEYSGLLGPGVSKLASWRTTYIVPSGEEERQLEMNAVVSKLEIVSDFAGDIFKLDFPDNTIVQNSITGEDYVQKPSGKRVPVIYTEGEPSVAAATRAMDETRSLRWFGIIGGVVLCCIAITWLLRVRAAKRQY